VNGPVGVRPGATPPLGALPVVPGWDLRPAPHGTAWRTSRSYTALPGNGGPALLLRVQRVADHPLRACYPYGAHDLAVRVEPAEPSGAAGPDLTARLLGDLVPALFAAEPRCRRVVAAPDEDDTVTRDALEAGGFRRIAEADLPGGSVLLCAVEAPAVAGVPTALDDMPH
jgi:hypothetical protein